MNIPKRISVTIGCLISLLVCGQAVMAGVVVFGPFLDFKGIAVVPVPGDTWSQTFISTNTHTLGIEWPNPGTFINTNIETLTWQSPPSVVAFPVFNVVCLALAVPEPPDGPALDPDTEIEIFSVTTSGSDGSNPDDLGPLPSGVTENGASFYGNNGVTYPVTVTPITDLTDLPTSSAIDASITWNLSAFTTTTGNFDLESVIVPEAAIVPEPSTFALLGIGTVSLLGYAARRRTAKA